LDDRLVRTAKASRVVCSADILYLHTSWS